MINLNISSVYYLNIGENELIFEILKSEFIISSIFRYEIFISKSKVYIKVIDYEDNNYSDNLITIKLLYYFINYSIYPLSNQIINLYIYQKLILKYDYEFKTNDTGYLEVNLYPSQLYLIGKREPFSIILSYNGTKYFDKALISFNSSIIVKSTEDFWQLKQLYIIIMVSVFAVVAIVFFLIKNINRKNQNIKLKDITFKF
jgi:hypothetical protein